MHPAIYARGLTKRFGETPAVEAIDLDVAQREIFGLIGPNGAGKTTLIQLLAALLDPAGGSASVLGCDVVRDASKLRQRVGYVSQEFTLYSALSVDENLTFFADLYSVERGVRERRKEELLRWSRLQPFRTRQAGRLSGGMQKKLHLCCSLIHEPELLFLDEPTTGVDPVSRRELWEILYDLVARGLTLVVATPYMDEAEQCHQVALMHGGKILRSGSPDSLKGGVTETVWELRAPALARAQEIFQKARLSFRSHLMGDRVHILASGTTDVTAEVLGLLGSGNVEGSSLRRISPTMEDVFASVLSKVQVGGEMSRRFVDALSTQAKRNHGGVAVRLEGLTKAFGDFVAVDRLSLSVVEGEVFGFLGPNGCGKTTTIRMLCGLLQPSEGRAEVLGKDVIRSRYEIKQSIGYMSQRFSLYNDLTVAENLAFFGGGYGLSSRQLAEQAGWALEMGGLHREKRRLVRELSAGVRQRLALACAILHEPAVIFLDEPTAGVDPIARREFWELIAALASAGTTVFVTTHYLDEAENCHRLGLMYQGQLVAVGSPRELKDGMRAGIMLELECREPFAAVRHLRAVPPLARANLFGNRIHVLVEDRAEAEPMIRQALRPQGISVERLEPIPFSLEDLFVIFIDMVEQGRREKDG